MSFLIPTNAVQIARFANGLYGAQLGFASTNGIVSDVASGGLVATFNNYYSLSFGAMTTTAVAQQVITNLGIVAGSNGQTASSVSVALAYVTGQLNAAAPAARGAAVKSVLDLWSSISADPVNGATYGAAATTWNNQISKAVQYAGAVNPDLTIAAAALIPAAPNSISLSTTTDNITGNPSASNQISAIFGTGATANFNPGDTISPAGTNGNSITLSDNGTGGTASPTGIAAVKVSNIQTAIISSGETLTVDTNSTASGSQGWAGLTSLTVSDVGTTGNNTTVNAAATTDISLNETSSAATTATVTGGRNLNINVSGNATAGVAGGALTIGGSTAALQPVGTVSATLVTSALAGSQTTGAITSTGGTVVSLTNTITAPTATTTASATQNVTIAGNTTVTGTANTTAVTVSQTTPAQQTFVINWQAIASATGAPTEVVTTAGGTYTITGQASTAYTAQQVAAVAAGAIIPGLTLSTSTSSANYTLGAPSATGTTLASSVALAGVGQLFPASTGQANGGVAPTLTATTGGIYTGTVSITDVNGASTTAAGTITSVTLNGLSLNATAGSTTTGSATITANSLANLTINNVSLAGGATVTLTNNLTVPSSTAALNLTLSGISGTGGLTLTDTNAELTALNITTNSASATNLVNTVALTTGYSKVKSITVAGNNTINISTLVGMTGLSSLSVTGGAGLVTVTTNSSTTNTALTAITSSSSGYIGLSLTSTAQSFTSTGTGADYITIAAVATKAIQAGTAPDDAIIWNGTTVPTTVGTVNNFNIFGLGASAPAGTYNMATLVDSKGPFNKLLISGGNSQAVIFSNVPVGTALFVDSANTGTVTFNVAGTTGATTTLPLTLGNTASTDPRVAAGALTATSAAFTLAGLTLQDSSTTAQTVTNGVGTLTVVGNASRDGQVHIITTVTDTALSTINNSGAAGLQIGTISGDLATSLTWNNTSPSVTASGLTTLTGTTWNNLNSITLTGTGPIALTAFGAGTGIPVVLSAARNDVLTSTSAAMTITNTNTASTTASGVVTATPAIVNFVDDSLATLTFAGTAPITSSIRTQSTSISIVNNNTFVPASATAQNVSVSFNDTALNTLIISGTGRTFINTASSNVNGLISAATSFNLTDTNTGAVQLGATIAPSSTSGVVAGGANFAAAATSQTFIQSGSGTLTVNSNMSTAGTVPTITLVGGVAFNLLSAMTGAFTISGSSDTAVIKLGANSATPLASGGLHTITTGSGADIVYDSNTAANTVILGAVTGTDNNTYVNNGITTAANAVTVGNGNNTIIFSGAGTGGTTINIGNGANNIALGLHTTTRANIAINASQTNGPNFTNVTLIGNIGGTATADVAGVTASVASAIATSTVTLSSATGVSIGATISAAAGIQAGTVITGLSGNVATLSAPVTAALAAGTALTIQNLSTGGMATDIITFANAAINTSIASQGATAVASIAAGVSAAQQSAAGYSNFIFGGNFYIYENTGFAATSELIGLIGTGHTYTVTSTVATITA